MKKMPIRQNARKIAVAIVFAASLAGGAALAQNSLGMLDTLDKGGWEVRSRDQATARNICLRSGRELIQLRHNESGCNRFVVEDGKSEVTVQYTCRGNGYGRTSIRKENPGLVQIESQGIVDGRPFQFSAEARYTGRCR